MYDVMKDFKEKSLELLDPSSEYFLGAYAMNLSHEAGFGVVKLRRNCNMVAALAESISKFKVRALAGACLAISAEPADEGFRIKDKALLLLGVDEQDRFFALKRSFKAQARTVDGAEQVKVAISPDWKDVTEEFRGSEPEELLMELKLENSFDLSTVDDIKGPIVADIKIL